MTKIVVDAMGGDFAPNEQVRGAVLALNKDANLSIILVGDKPQIEEILKYYRVLNEKYNFSSKNMKQMEEECLK